MEMRAIRPVIRALDTETGMPHRFVARVINYGVLDEFGTGFDPGVFKRSLEDHLPRVVWAHDWREPIGRYVDYRDAADGLDLIGELDDFEAVPRARQAFAQMRSGTLDQFSVGFVPTKSVKRSGKTWFTEADLEEVSIILAGAVPGTKLLALRASPRLHLRGPSVDADQVAKLMIGMHDGTLDLADALQALKSLPEIAEKVEDPEAPAEDPETDGDSDEEPEEGVSVATGDTEAAEGAVDTPGTPEGQGEATESAWDELDLAIDEAMALLDRSSQGNVEMRAAVGVHHTATDDGSWDGPANEKRVQPGRDTGYYRAIYAWQNPDGDPKTKAGWSFIHHEVGADGSPGAANLTACSTGIGILNGGRGATGAWSGDKAGIYAHLAAHLRDAKKEPPKLG